jgi:aryl-alcohol dehydrogenase-like predicted oxidoreductase
MSDFLHRPLPHLGKPVHRLGLACNYGIQPSDFEHAVDRGVNYIFWTAFRTSALRPPLVAALKKDRERFVVATGAGPAYFGWNVRRAAEAALKELQTDYLDVFQLYWLGITSAWTEGTVEALLKLKEEGKIRSLGVSIHDRPRAAKLAEDSPLDLLMIRYNAAHPGAESEIFPSLARRQPAVVAYTATSWGRLLKAPAGWTEKVPTAADCYRFCLSSPHVDLVLTGPANRQELDQNLDGLEKGPLSAEEDRWIRQFGKAVHG